MKVPSYYSVLQYIPDPLFDERVNIGVVATDSESTAAPQLALLVRPPVDGNGPTTSLPRGSSERLTPTSFHPPRRTRGRAASQSRLPCRCKATSGLEFYRGVIGGRVQSSTLPSAQLPLGTAVQQQEHGQWFPARILTLPVVGD